MSANLRAVPASRPRAVLYLRQSTARDESISLELQEIAGRDHCARSGYDVVRVEVDEGISGRTWAKRPAVQRVMDMIEARDADVIVLWKWSRLSRSRKDWAVAADRVDVAGGRIESATEPIDTATASGRFARGVMTEYAAFQSEQIGEQWGEAHDRRFKMGLPPKGPLPWGWESHGDRISISEEKAAIVREMYQLYFEGRGMTYIATWMINQGIPAKRGGIWRAQSVISCLESPIHAGRVTFRGETRDGAHAGIISEAEWERFLRLRKDRTQARPPRVTNHLLSTLVRCHCGLKSSGSKGTSRWANGRKVYHSYKCSSPAAHPRKSLITWKVDQAVVRWLKARAVDTDREASALPGADIEKLARDVLAVDRRLDALTEHLVSGLVPRESYVRTRDMLVTEGERLRAALHDAEQSTRLTPAHYLDGVRDGIERWDSLQLEDKQVVVRSLIREVMIREDGLIAIQPHWRQGDPDVVAPPETAVS